MASLTSSKLHLEGYNPCNFPSLDTASPGESSSVSAAVPLGDSIHGRIQFFCDETGINVDTVFRVAWGLVLRAYTGQDSVSFGDVLITCDTNSIGRLISVGVCQEEFSDTVMISKVLWTVQAARAGMLSNSEAPPSGSMRFMSNSSPLFNTCISFLSKESQKPERPSSPMEEAEHHPREDQYDIIVRCNVEKGDRAHITLDYQTSLLSEAQATSIAHTLERAISGIIGDDREIGQIDLLSDLDKSKIYQRNKYPPFPAHRRIDAFILERCLSQPMAPAICAWDGEFSYGELEHLSLALAQNLASKGVGPEIFVPLCFDKSRWTTVAMLGVTRAGGAFVLLDPSHPAERLLSICQKVSARLIIASAQHAKLAADLAATVIEIGEREGKGEGEAHWISDKSKQTQSTDTMLLATPRNALYAVFTSGSTGTPKGVVSEHASFHAAVSPYIQAVGLDQESRVFQFSSYAFDVTIFDTLMTLISGGCVCVPSNTDRWSDVANAIRHFRVTHISLTPTVARILDPKEMPTLRTLVLGGERLTTSDMAKWVDHVRMVSLYGASECSIMSLQSIAGTSSDLHTVDYATGSACWIVDPNNHERLLPIGTIGELVIEGPIIGRGYLNDPEKAAATFIQPPAWLRQFRGDGCCSTIYKSGDLVQYAADGSLQFIGRKDTQVKLRGQRIELGDVEHHVQKVFPSVRDVVVEVVTSLDLSRPPMLVAFVRNRVDPESIIRRQAAVNRILAEPTHWFLSQIPMVQSQLQKLLPSYMVPAIFIPLSTLPLTNTDKINRKLLRELAAALSREEWERYQPSMAVSRTPKTTTEKLLQSYFARVLTIPLEQVRADDHFFYRGGDSLAAMRLVAMARKDNHKLTVQDVFNHPVLSALATVVQAGMGNVGEEPPPAPFSLMNACKQRDVIRDVARQCRLPVRSIEDVYPCTPLQRGFMSETMRDPGAFVANLAFFLPSHIDLQRLKAAWTAVANANPILRTRMVLSATHGLLQAVIREDIQWTVSKNSGDRDFVIGIGKPLVQLVLYPHQEGHQDQYQLFLQIHHAVYDAWTLPLIFADVEAAYQGNSLVPRPVGPFIRYLQSTPNSDGYWKSLMENLQSPVFPALPSETYQPSPNATASYTIVTAGPSARQFTPNTYMRLGWAITQARRQGTRDVFFGVVVSGRNAPVASIESMTVPTVATVPYRVALDPQSTVRSVLHKIQEDTITGIPFEQFGLTDIRHLGKHTALACSFRTLLVMTPVVESNSASWFEPTESAIDYRADATYAINLIFAFERDEVKATAVYDANVTKEDEMQRLLADFGHVLQALHKSPNGLIRDMLIVPEQSIINSNSLAPI